MAKLLKVYVNSQSEHPQQALKRLGVTYQYAIPQSLFDLWEFWNPENLPDTLPDGFLLVDENPDRWLNRGLSIDMIYEIKKQSTKK